ncbi:hypothetical protein HZC07_05570 [Candidatus Micrarchaeota archaeon]|nr:hypothetical protein [Candidatus Micrarchaeota archaeon]
MFPRQAISYHQLLKEGFSDKEIFNLSASLKLFPTPFKGIYYVPANEEKRGSFIDKPLSVITKATELFLGTNKFYFSCSTAEEFLGINWRPKEEIHIVNETRSGRINLSERIERNKKKNNYRSKKIALLLSFYGHEIIFHRGSVDGAKFKETPYGRFALKSQIKKDKKRFREKNRRNKNR